MGAVKNFCHDAIERRAAREDGFRVCDDCDFVTEDADITICPHCKGSVG